MRKPSRGSVSQIELHNWAVTLELRPNKQSGNRSHNQGCIWRLGRYQRAYMLNRI